MMETEDGTSGPEVTGSSIDLGQLDDYLVRICPVLLDAESAPFEAALKSPAAQDKLKKFVSDTKIPALLVRKRITENAEEDTGGGVYNQPLQSILPSMLTVLQISSYLIWRCLLERKLLVSLSLRRLVNQWKEEQSL